MVTLCTPCFTLKSFYARLTKCIYVLSTDLRKKKLLMRLSLVLKVVPSLRRLVVGLSPQRPGFDPRTVHVKFVVERVILG